MDITIYFSLLLHVHCTINYLRKKLLILKVEQQKANTNLPQLVYKLCYKHRQGIANIFRKFWTNICIDVNDN